MPSLVEFLQQRLDEDEAAARAATEGWWAWDTADDSQGDHHLLALTDDWYVCPHGCRWGEPSITSRGGQASPGRHEHRRVEQVVASWGHDAWGIDVGEADAAHIARHDPARVLREVEAKRAVVVEHAESQGSCDTCSDAYHPWADFEQVEEPYPCPTLRHLAAIWQDHPDYDPFWRP